jgi:hypothetical protein
MMELVDMLDLGSNAISMGVRVSLPSLKINLGVAKSGKAIDFGSIIMGSNPITLKFSFSLVSLAVKRPAFNRCDTSSNLVRGKI